MDPQAEQNSHMYIQKHLSLQMLGQTLQKNKKTKNLPEPLKIFPNTSHNRPQTSANPPNGAQMVLYWSQNDPKVLPKYSQNGPKMLPKSSQTVPSSSKLPPLTPASENLRKITIFLPQKILK